MFELERLEEVKWEQDNFMEHPYALTAGHRLQQGRYEILKLDEVSDRTFIYQAMNLDTSETVSIKEFFPREALGIEGQLYFERDLETGRVYLKDETPMKLEQLEALVDGFIEEARYLEKISYGDPILSITDSFEDNGTAYLVTNYNPWPSLNDFFLQGYLFTESEVDWIGKSLLSIIARFHKRGIVHRNISPKNIYIKTDEIVIDSLGTCDFLQDIKIYDANAYDNKYYAPEIMMHDGVIGMWSDIYAVGKIFIEMICHMTPTRDYFDGLNTMSEKRNASYAAAIKGAICFRYEERIGDANQLMELLYPEPASSSRYKTPKSMIAMIAMISLISCALVIWQYNNEQLLSDGEYRLFEEEQIPAGAPAEMKALYFINKDMDAFELSGKQELLWYKQADVEMKRIKIKSIVTDFSKTFALEGDAISFSMGDVEMVPGLYTVVLYGEQDGNAKSDSIEIKIVE